MIPFVGPSYTLNTRKADVQRAVNLFPVTNEVAGGKTGAYMQSVPGLDSFSASVPPPSDPFWADVILHLNAETGIAFDSSPLHKPLTNLGVTAQTVGPLEGLVSLNLTGGKIQATADSFYQSALGANEWTLRGWIKVISYPINSEERFFDFAPGYGSCFASDNSIGWNGSVGSASIGVKSAANTLHAGIKQFFAITRTNNGSNSHLELFLSPNDTSPAVYYSSSSNFLATAPMGGSFSDFGWVAGYVAGSAVILDDFQLTNSVNRYKGLTSFPVPTGPLPTNAP